ncbi:sigma factor [uncultured Negativibacillus sp.]|uniref:RNA polymerase sigma factor n=1 Tax=uncultured Negativibacillus sp. TaxID=1980696 RepID=UPI0025DC4175|nr:sigma factor [uncultured Negativibacillus sp.]
MIRLLKPSKKTCELERIEQLYQEYKVPLWRYAYKLLHDEHLADDVVQSVFTKAIEKSSLICSLDCNKPVPTSSLW